MAIANTRMTLRPLSVPLTTEVALVGADLDFDPRYVAGLILWLQNNAALTDGTAVPAWPDRSGLGNAATQAVAGQKPLYKAGIINGRPVVRFDGVDDELTVSGFAISDLSFFVVAIRHTTVTDRIVYQYNGATPSGFSYSHASGVGFFEPAQAAGTSWTSQPASGEAYIATGKKSGTGSTAGTFYKNGAVQGVSAQFDATATTANLHIGKDAAGLSATDADIAAVIIYSRSCIQTEQRRVERYLGRTYGIAVSS